MALFARNAALWLGGRRFGPARRAGEAAGRALDERVVAAIAVVGFGEGVEVEEFQHEVVAQGQVVVAHVFGELGDGGDDWRIGVKQGAVFGEFGDVEVGGQHFGMLRGEDEAQGDGGLALVAGFDEVVPFLLRECDQKRQVRADGGNSGVPCLKVRQFDPDNVRSPKRAKLGQRSP